MPRVKHPDWLHAIVRQHDDTYKQKDLKSMFGKAVDAGATVMDLEVTPTLPLPRTRTLPLTLPLPLPLPLTP